MLYFKLFLLLVTVVGGTAALTVGHTLLVRDVQASATVNGSCISAPDTSCISLVGLCVTNIASGQTPASRFWSDRICTAAATCAGMGPVLNAACCAGTCHQPIDMGSLDYDNIYFGMVGECAFEPGGCSLTWQPFVDWFYNTIQETNTNLWPESGDVVLDWWARIATWTAFCEGDNCVDSAIPYTNFNDWFHYSSAVIVTTPGTPEYVAPLSTDLAENDDNWTPDFSWPCPFDDSTDCWWDYGSPTTALSLTSETRDLQVRTTRKFTLAGDRTPTKFSVHAASNISNPYQIFGRGKNQPANVPPPTYVLGEPLELHLNGTRYTPPSSRRSFDDDILAVAQVRALHHKATNTIQPIVPCAITTNPCGGAIDTPTTLPTINYYCSLLPSICANIRSHPDFKGPSMKLTWDPFSASTGARRNEVCTRAVRAAFQAAGRCDLKQHNAACWNVSCDEFPFNSVLEGGAGNAITRAVPTREQEYQSALQSPIINLRRVATDGTSVWKGASNRMCHSFQIKLLESPEAGAPTNAVGSLDAGSAFFSTGLGGIRFITHKNVQNIPQPYAKDTDYPATESNLHVPSNSRVFDCRPCTIGFVPVPPAAVDDEEDFKEQASAVTVEEGEDETTPSPTAPPKQHQAALDRRASSSCTKTTTTSAATSTQEATQAASHNIAAAAAAASAAAAAASAATDATLAEAVAAIAAVSAANALGPAAAALTVSTSDSAFAAAIAAAEAAVEAAQDAAAAVYGLGPGTPDSIISVADQVTSASSSIADAMYNVHNVIPPQTPIPPDIDPAKNPNVNLGPPPNTPKAACFGAGSTGFLKLGDSYFTNANGNAPAKLVDVGSDAFFGLTIPTDRTLLPVVGCPGVYGWADDVPLAPDFQVDCSTLELGSYWNGVKQECYSYITSPGFFEVLCGNNLGGVYSCLQGLGLYGTLTPAFINWATS